MNPRGRLVAPAAAMFRACVRLYPLRFRRAYGGEMERLFRRRMVRASAAGSGAFARCLVLAFADILGGALAERFAPRRRAPERVSLSAALSDLRLIVHRLALRDRHFALFACGTMALGLASAALIFSLVNGLLLRPLPYKDPEHLVRIAASHSASRTMNRNLSRVSFGEVRAVPALSAAAAYTSRGLNVTVGTEPHRVAGATASPELFGVLAVNPLAGRVFSFEEARRGEPVAVVSALLVDRAGWAVPDALGRTMTIDGQDRTVIGVMPASFRFPETTQVWIPLGPAPLTDAIEGDLAVVARLRAGGAAALQEQMQAAANAMAEAGHEPGWRFHTRPLNPLRAEGLAPILFTAVAGAALLLIVVTANVAALMLARGIGRQAEFGVMVALGASRQRIVMHLLLESAVIAAAAGGCALLLTAWMLAYVPRVLPVAELPEWMQFAVDGRVVLFTFIAALLGAAGTGLIPSLQATTGDIASLIRAGSRTVAGGRATRLQRALIGVQLLVVTVLLTGGGLMLRSYLALARANPGYDPAGVYMLETELPQARYGAGADVARFYAALLGRLEGSGGIRAAAVAGGTRAGRTGTQGTGSFEEIELLGATASSRTARVEQVVVSSGFFETLSLALREGRPFRANEPNNTAIVSEAFARRYWPAAPALEQSIGVHTSEGLRVVRVIGVAGDMRDAFAGEGARRAVPPRLYLPLDFGISRGATVYARGREGSDESVAAAIRAAVNASDPDQAVWATTSLVDFLAVTRLPVKWFGYLLGACSVMALLVACVGLHGVVSFSVRRRRREFAIRATFGARPGQIVGTILRDALRPSIIGLALGIAGGAVFGRAMSTLLYGVPTFDMLVTAVTAMFLLSAVVVASVVPAIRLSRLEPSRLLRAD